MYWVLDWDRGGMRGYNATDQDDAHAQRARSARYPAEVQVAIQADGSASLTFLVSRERMTRGDIVRIARLLHQEGITRAYSTREEGHGMPFGVPVTEGHMAGTLFFDLAAIVAGADGSY